ncbi:MAG: pyrimidine dimer DNA glycosylase/endonuclease V, partial [Pyrinomonadaceae bacterium]
PVTDGQLLYEFEWLRSKLRVRDPKFLESFSEIRTPLPHPLFRIVPGDVEAWEIISHRSS